MVIFLIVVTSKWHISHLKKDFSQNTVFVQLDFNLSNGVTDTLESSTILIYFETREGLFTQHCGKMPYLIKQLIKRRQNLLAR